MNKIPYILLLLFLSACYYDNEEELYPRDQNCDLSKVTFATTIKPIIAQNCAIPGCHVPGGTGSSNFQIYDELKAKVDNGSFERRTIIEESMPPNRDLSACDIDKLKTWLTNGARND